jgi:hypothetical protein
MKDGSPAFELLDAEGQRRIVIMLDTCGSAVVQLEAVGGASIKLNVTEDGTVGLSINRHGGLPALSVGCEPNEELRLIVFDAEGRPRAFSLDPSQRPGAAPQTRRA